MTSDSERGSAQVKNEDDTKEGLRHEGVMPGNDHKDGLKERECLGPWGKGIDGEKEGRMEGQTSRNKQIGPA
jgi:hypothetical protein